MDAHVGSELPAWEVPSVSAEKMKTMAALLADPNPIHWDAEAVAALGMGNRPINQGPLNMGYVMNMLAAWSGGHDRLRRFRIRFLGNVVAGHRLSAGGVVTAIRQEDGARVADCDVHLTVVGGEAVLKGTATVVLPNSHEE
jgi:acyl dehydratase